MKYVCKTTPESCTRKTSGEKKKIVEYVTKSQLRLKNICFFKGDSQYRKTVVLMFIFKCFKVIQLYILLQL